MAECISERCGHYTVEISAPEPELNPGVIDLVKGPERYRAIPHSDGRDGELIIRAVIGKNADVPELMRRVEAAMDDLGFALT